MAALTVRNLSDETHRALKARAAANHRSTEAEVRAILDAAVRPERNEPLGDFLARIGRESGAEIDIQRDQADLTALDLA